MPTTKLKTQNRFLNKNKAVEPALVNKIETHVQGPDISHGPPPSSHDAGPIPCVCVEGNAKLTVSALRKLCKERGIKGYSKMNKEGLLILLSV